MTIQIKELRKKIKAAKPTQMFDTESMKVLPLEKSERALRSKIDLTEAVKMRESGETFISIGKKYGVTPQAVSSFLKRKSLK